MRNELVQEQQTASEYGGSRGTLCNNNVSSAARLKIASLPLICGARWHLADNSVCTLAEKAKIALDRGFNNSSVELDRYSIFDQYCTWQINMFLSRQSRRKVQGSGLKHGQLEDKKTKYSFISIYIKMKCHFEGFPE